MHLSTIHIRVSRNKASPTPMPSQNMQMTILCLNFSVYISPHFWEEGSQSYHNAKDCTCWLQSRYQGQHREVKSQTLSKLSTYVALARSAESSDSTFKKRHSIEPCKISLLKELKINQTYRNDEYSSRSRLAMPWYLCSHPSHCWSYSGISHSLQEFKA